MSWKTIVVSLMMASKKNNGRHSLVIAKVKIYLSFMQHKKQTALLGATKIIKERKCTINFNQILL